jgi:WD40 repeat protein
MLGGKLLHSFSNHQKTITSLSLDSSGSRILSGSLDGLVKIYDVATYEVVHGMKYNTPLLSVALSVNENKTSGFVVNKTTDQNCVPLFIWLQPALSYCLHVCNPTATIQPENKLLVAGTSDGTLCTRKREVKVCCCWGLFAAPVLALLLGSFCPVSL